MYRVSIYVATNNKVMKRTDKRYGYILYYQDKKGDEYIKNGKADVTGTWNQATLAALIEAMGRVKQICEITFYSDNEFILNAISNQLDKWRDNGYQTVRGKDVANKEQWQQLGKLLKNHRVMTVKGVHEYTENIMYMMERG